MLTGLGPVHQCKIKEHADHATPLHQTRFMKQQSICIRITFQVKVTIQSNLQYPVPMAKVHTTLVVAEVDITKVCSSGIKIRGMFSNTNILMNLDQMHILEIVKIQVHTKGTIRTSGNLVKLTVIKK